MNLNRYEWTDVADMLCVDACIGDVVALMRVEKEVREACCDAIRAHLGRSEEKYLFNSTLRSTDWRNESGQPSRYCDRPAIVWIDGSRAWVNDNKIHRASVDASGPEGTHLPAFINASGTREWSVEGQRHRDDVIPSGRGWTHLPAYNGADGSCEWYVRGKLHRDDIDPITRKHLPAVIRANGSREWYVNGKRHRADIESWRSLNPGPRKPLPAVIHATGTCMWYVNGVKRER
jgi:hypothetical protein